MGATEDYIKKLRQNIEDLAGKAQVLEEDGDWSAAEALRNQAQVVGMKLNEALARWNRDDSSTPRS